MAEQERNDFVRSIRLSLLDLARRIEYASSADQVEYVIVRLRQITRHSLRLEGVEGLTEEMSNLRTSSVEPSTPSLNNSNNRRANGILSQRKGVALWDVHGSK